MNDEQLTATRNIMEYARKQNELHTDKESEPGMDDYNWIEEQCKTIETYIGKSK